MVISLVITHQSIFSQGKAANFHQKMYAEMEAAANLEEKVQILYRITKYGFGAGMKPRQNVIKYLNEAKSYDTLQLKDRTKYIYRVCMSYLESAESQFQEQKENLTECLSYFSKDQTDKMYLDCLSLLGNVCFTTGSYERALIYLSELITRIDIENPAYSLAIRRLTRTYAALHQDSVALELISKMIVDNEARKKFKWNAAHMRHYSLKAGVLNKMGDTDGAIEHLKIAMAQATKANNKPLIANFNQAFAVYNLELGRIELAKEYAKKAYDHYEILKVNYPSMLAIRNILGRIYFEDGQYKLSKDFFEDALDRGIKKEDLGSQRNSLYGILMNDIMLDEDPETILNGLKYFRTFNDSMFNDNIAKTLNDAKVQFESEKKQAAIEQLNQENYLIEENLKSAKKNNVLLASALILLFISGVSLFILIGKRIKSQKLLEEQNKIIQKSLSDKQLLLKEIHHRVKNNLQTVSSLLSLQTAYVQDDNVINALKEGQNRVQSMALIHQNLYQEDDLREIKIKSYFEKLIKGLYQSYKVNQDKIKLDLDIDDIMLDIETIIPLGLITNELVSNVFKYAFNPDQHGQLHVSLKSQDAIKLLVKDDGKGIDSEKVTNNNASFGYQMINAFCKKLGAELIVKNENGTEVIILIEKSNQ